MDGIKKRFNVKLLNNSKNNAIDNFSIEVMPKTAAKINNFNDILPVKTNIYIAHLDNVDFNDMLSTAKRLVLENYNVTPHFPARIIKDKKTLEDWIKKYSDCGVNNCLLIAGNQKKPYGDFSSSVDLIKTGFFDKYSFKNIFVAGHPEGNKDIDFDGSNKNILKYLLWKNEFSQNTNANVSITTQFCFDSKTIINWIKYLEKNNIYLPLNIGIPGPAKLQTMIKFAISCGVGPSLKVLEKKAKDLTKLILPYKPIKLLNELTDFIIENPSNNIKSVHFFPLGGITKTVEFVEDYKNKIKEKSFSK